MPDTELLYETPDTLTIGNDGKAKREHPGQEYTGASLSGPIPRYGHQGQRGIGGSLVSEAMQGKAEEHGQHTVDHRDLSPEALMKWADDQEKDILRQSSEQIDGSSAVDPALIRTGYMGDAPPAWLAEYIEETQPQPSVQFGGTTVVDRVMGNKYLQEHEKLKMLRDMQRAQGTK